MLYGFEVVAWLIIGAGLGAEAPPISVPFATMDACLAAKATIEAPFSDLYDIPLMKDNFCVLTGYDQA